MSGLVPAYAGAGCGAPTVLGDLAVRMPRLTRRFAAAHGAVRPRQVSRPTVPLTTE